MFLRCLNARQAVRNAQTDHRLSNPRVHDPVTPREVELEDDDSIMSMEPTRHRAREAAAAAAATSSSSSQEPDSGKSGKDEKEDPVDLRRMPIFTHDGNMFVNTSMLDTTEGLCPEEDASTKEFAQAQANMPAAWREQQPQEDVWCSDLDEKGNSFAAKWHTANALAHYSGNKRKRDDGDGLAGLPSFLKEALTKIKEKGDTAFGTCPAEVHKHPRLPERVKWPMLEEQVISNTLIWLSPSLIRIVTGYLLGHDELHLLGPNDTVHCLVGKPEIPDECLETFQKALSSHVPDFVTNLAMTRIHIARRADRYAQIMAPLPLPPQPGDPELESLKQTVSTAFDQATPHVNPLSKWLVELCQTTPVKGVRIALVPRVMLPYLKFYNNCGAPPSQCMFDMVFDVGALIRDQTRVDGSFKAKTLTLSGDSRYYEFHPPQTLSAFIMIECGPRGSRMPVLEISWLKTDRPTESVPKHTFSAVLAELGQTRLSAAAQATLAAASSSSSATITRTTKSSS